MSVTVNIQEGAISAVGLALVVSVIASFAALAYFYRVMAGRETEHTAQTPPDLAEAAAYLRSLPGQRVLVLPTMYADFIAYSARKAVVPGPPVEGRQGRKPRPMRLSSPQAGEARSALRGGPLLVRFSRAASLGYLSPTYPLNRRIVGSIVLVAQVLLIFIVFVFSSAAH